MLSGLSVKRGLADTSGLSVSPSSLSITNTRFGAGTCYSGLQINTSGIEYKNASESDTTFNVSRGDWLDLGSSDDVWVERTINTGGLNWLDAGAGRLNLGTTREYGVSEGASSGSQPANVTFDYYDAVSGGNLLDSVTVVFLATKEP